MTISIKGLSKTFKSHQVLKGIDLTLEPGKIYGLIGNNGVGKTTTMSILTGLLKADEGSITGLDHLTIGYLPETPSFYDYMSGLEYIKHLQALHGNDHESVKKYVGFFKLDESIHRKIRTYSRGMKQKLGIIACLAVNPDILILDEPSSALDPAGRQQVLTVINELKESGKTILLSSHILDDVEKICDHVAFMHDGRIIKFLTQDSMDASNFDQPWTLATIDGLVFHGFGLDASTKKMKELLTDGKQIKHFSMASPSLDDVFRKVVDEYETAKDTHR